jgi:hypothetical protein
MRRGITESFMVVPVAVVLDEGFNRSLQFTGHPVGQETCLWLDPAVVSFYLAIGLKGDRVRR